MRTTIDGAGRIVVPKQLRDAAQLVSGQELEIIERDGRIEIEPVAGSMELVERDGFLAAEVRDEVRDEVSDAGEGLTSEQVRDVLDRTRR